MNIILQGDTFALNMTTEEEDETKIEQLFSGIIPLTPEIQSAINAKYGTLAERQARKSKYDKPENKADKLLDRIAELEAKVNALEKK
ncbi:MAG: hypothetical protein R3E39_26350 [Anaerolineae bacterium]